MNLVLTRDPHGNGLCTTGRLQAGELVLYTLERAWMQNAPDDSCVPPGAYSLQPYDSIIHGHTWQLHNPELNVWGLSPARPAPQGMRSLIELHSANWVEQLKGCIALGLANKPMYSYFTDRVEPAVEESRDAVEALLECLKPMSTGHTLEIM